MIASNAEREPTVERGTQFADLRARMSREVVYRRRPERLRRYLAFGAITSTLEWGLLWAGGVSPWRLLALAFLLLLPFGFGLAKRHSPPPTERDFLRSNVIFLVNMGARLALTGGLHSPLLPMLGAMIVQPVIILGPQERSFRFGAWTLLLIVIVGLLPTTITGPSIEGWPYAALIVLSLATALAIVGELLKINAQIQEQATEAIISVYDERVAEAEAHGRRLQSVGGKVAHELKNPLAAIKGLVQLMARGANESRTQQRLDVVQGEIERMELILREYLSFSRPLEDLEPEPIDLADLVERVTLVIAGRAEQAQIRVSIDTEPVPLVGDPRRLQEALLNLMANAIEACTAGGWIEVSARPTVDGGRVEIRDSGRGIAPEDLERLGCSFFTTRADGNGLGVVLVIGVVAQHGGRLRFASEAGRGTRVTLDLPRSPAPVPSSAVLSRVSVLGDEPERSASASTTGGKVRKREAQA